MHIDQEDLELVRQILKEYIPERKVKAFGSRVHGRHLRKFSDLDLVVMGDEPLDFDVYCKLKEAFVESDLPIRVDVGRWASMDDDFRKIIEESNEDIQ